MKLGAAVVLAMLAPLAAASDSMGLILLTDPDGRPRLVNGPGGVPRVSTGAVPAGATERRALLLPIVREIAASHGLDPNLVDLVIRMESGYNPRAVSHKGAQGVMQLMPATASLYGVSDVFDARQNIEGGVQYLRDMLLRYQSNLSLALAAYNAGPGAVDRYGGVPPFRETRNYVDSILGAYRGGASPLLGGGFGTSVRRGPPPRAVQDADGRVVISNVPPSAAPAVNRRLRL